ncbi:DUF3578 domain-containing protein [Bradyrhizobium xenonodulans]|uniref:DUF3578 domain-containing protein n=1 Tax=Bradyrhizobium xenonodulans TaxID=2736875 RepID=A0ABY7MBF4_9BRAD|nr:DUF3578 domain-containing protein [Bradyrhizobium xenonodulans]WBL75578.1 DUF3578 domain-containing protein [Bradyrhizobium xenonodulans]
MSLNEIIHDIRAGWAAYRAEGTVSKAHPEYTRVVRDFRRELELHIGAGRSYRIEGSTGKGNITSAPWVATFDRSVTNSATQGFYLVYLFSVDLRRLYLSLAFGTTQFGEYFTNVQERHLALRAAAAHVGALIHPGRNLHFEPLDLAAEPRDRMHFDYEQSSIVAIGYDLDALPDDAHLVTDYVFMLELYRDLVANPLLPNLQQLLEAEIAPAAVQAEPNVKLFEPRAPRRAKGSGSGNGRYRLSKESKKVGDAGEQIVFDYEIQKVRQLGFDETEVRWLARDGETPGWDITSLNAAGETIYIEVKASVGSEINGLLITAKEWAAAFEHGPRYHIYLVTDALKTTPAIEIIEGPAALEDLGHLAAKTAVWALDLAPPTADR